MIHAARSETSGIHSRTDASTRTDPHEESLEQGPPATFPNAVWVISLKVEESHLLAIRPQWRTSISRNWHSRIQPRRTCCQRTVRGGAHRLSASRLSASEYSGETDRREFAPCRSLLPSHRPMRHEIIVQHASVTTDATYLLVLGEPKWCASPRSHSK